MNVQGLPQGHNGTDSINKKIPTQGTAICSVASAGTLTIGEPVTANDTIVIDLIAYTFKTGPTYAKAQGTLKMATKPTDTNTVTIGDNVYTFVPTPSVAGDVAIGSLVGDSQDNLIIAINTGDTYNSVHPLVTIGAFDGADDVVVTAKLPGTDGNAIASTETLADGADVWDATTLGTTTLGGLLTALQIGIGADEAATKLAITAAIMGTDLVNTAHGTVIAGAFAGDSMVVTAKVAGVIGDSIPTTDTLTHSTNQFAEPTLGTTVAGVNGTSGKPGDQFIDTTYLYICVERATIAGNWRRIAIGSAF
jgi:hypothetical protein